MILRYFCCCCRILRRVNGHFNHLSKLIMILRHFCCRRRILLFLVLLFTLQQMIELHFSNPDAIGEAEPLEIFEELGPGDAEVGNLSAIFEGIYTQVKPPCPRISPFLIGHLKLDLMHVPSTIQEMSAIHGHWSSNGGHYSPPYCQPKEKVAIIIPFRDRQEHLRIFLHNIFPMLKRQLIEFNIFVIEQSDWSGLFNRAMLFNAGFTEASQISGFQFDCYIFHDVDLIPENDKNLYNCPDQPRHMSVAIDIMNYKLPYERIFGGISAMRTEHFQKVNGFSNMFWGEDDDMANRIAYHGLYISRPPPNIARYKMLKHKAQKLNDNRYKILHKGKTYMNNSGLSNLNYTIEQIILKKLFTLIRVKLHK